MDLRDWVLSMGDGMGVLSLDGFGRGMHRFRRE